MGGGTAGGVQIVGGLGEGGGRKAGRLVPGSQQGEVGQSPDSWVQRVPGRELGTSEALGGCWHLGSSVDLLSPLSGVFVSLEQSVFGLLLLEWCFCRWNP